MVDLPSKVTVQIDSREKYPLLFPAFVRVLMPGGRGKRVAIETETIGLSAGDYRLKEYPDVCVVERKGSASELHTNMFNGKDSARQGKAFRKLREQSSRPYLLIEASPAECMKFDCGKEMGSEAFMSRLSAVIARQDLNVIWIPWGRSGSPSKRRTLGGFVVHLMLGEVLNA